MQTTRRSPIEVQRAVLFALILRELKTRFGGRLIGLFWVLLEPALHIAMVLAIRVMLRDRFTGVMMDAPVYILAAMLPFFMARNIWFGCMTAVSANGGLFGYRQVKPLDTMIARAALEILIYISVYIVFNLIFLWLGYRAWPHHPLEYWAIWVHFIAMGFGLALISLVISHFLPPAAGFIRMLSTPLYLMSGVLIPIATFPPSFRVYLLWNPFLHMVETSRVAYFPVYNAMAGVDIRYAIEWAAALITGGLLLYWLRRTRLVSRTS